MKETEFQFKSHDETPIYAVKWEPHAEQSPKGIVQIVHGMAEHIGRYKRFAESLTNAGYLVYGEDHRGHGRTAKEGDPLFFHEENGWDCVVRDVKRFNDLIREEIPHLPIILFGHSMGSFISKCYIQRYGGSISGVILSGTGYATKWSNALPVWLAGRDVKRDGAQALSRTVAPIVAKRYLKPFQPIRSESDWLSRDEIEVDQFIQDPLTGQPPSAGFYLDMLKGMTEMDDPSRLEQIPKDLPVFLISGTRDVVGNFGKSIHKSVANYRKVGLLKVEFKLYEDARHELLNETNREEVTEDVLNWIDLQINAVQKK